MNRKKKTKNDSIDGVSEDRYLIEMEKNHLQDKEHKSADQLQINKIDAKKIRIKDSDDLKVAESVLDVETRTTLYNLRKKKIIEIMTGIISTGKEANVYHGYGPKKSEIAIKIYRTSTNIFKGLQKYILGDTRFANIKKDQRSFVYAWAKKEFKNLSRAFEAKVSVPEPIFCDKDVLVMEFIGKRELPYNLIKDETLNKPQKVYNEVLENMEKLYLKAGLIHADLSEYNIMYTPKIYFIDVSQAVLLDHPYAENFLYRDIKNINRFFRNQKANVIEDEILYEKLRGEPLTDKIKTFEI